MRAVNTTTSVWRNSPTQLMSTYSLLQFTGFIAKYRGTQNQAHVH